MKDLIGYGSIKVHTRTFSLEKFIESDAPGSLSWLNMDEDDMYNDILPLKESNEVEFHFPVPPLSWTSVVFPEKFVVAG